MPVDQDKIKKSLDDFENSNYVDSEEELKDQIKKSVKSHLKNKLGLKNNPDGTETEDSEETEEPEDSHNDDDSSNDDSEEEE